MNAVERTQWGVLGDGTPVERFSLVNGRGMRCVVGSYGASLVELTAPDAGGHMADVVLGYDTLAEYEAGEYYFGSTVGRVANRIGGARFSLDGREFRLEANAPEGQLHGGANGFHAQVWQGEPDDSPDGPSVIFSRISPDDEAGYPGTLTVSVTYTLLENGLRMDYQAETDAPTVVSLTNHAYFNLRGNPRLDVLDHLLHCNASRYLRCGPDGLPTGEIASCYDNPYDFSRPKALGLHIHSTAQGYDRYYIIDRDGEGLEQAADICHAESGRVLSVYTTQPGFQLYSGDHLPEGMDGKMGLLYGPRSGFCIETHGYVDAPNQSAFPSVALLPGDMYEHRTEYRFSVM